MDPTSRTEIRRICALRTFLAVRERVCLRLRLAGRILLVCDTRASKLPYPPPPLSPPAVFSSLFSPLSPPPRSIRLVSLFCSLVCTPLVFSARLPAISNVGAEVAKVRNAATAKERSPPRLADAFLLSPCQSQIKCRCPLFLLLNWPIPHSVIWKQLWSQQFHKLQTLGSRILTLNVLHNSVKLCCRNVPCRCDNSFEFLLHICNVC